MNDWQMYELYLKNNKAKLKITYQNHINTPNSVTTRHSVVCSSVHTSTKDDDVAKLETPNYAYPHNRSVTSLTLPVMYEWSRSSPKLNDFFCGLCATFPPITKFCETSFSSFCVMLLTNKQAPAWQETINYKAVCIVVINFACICMARHLMSDKTLSLSLCHFPGEPRLAGI